MLLETIIVYGEFDPVSVSYEVSLRHALIRSMTSKAKEEKRKNLCDFQSLYSHQIQRFVQFIFLFNQK